MLNLIENKIMAVDMTDETIAQYRQRIEEMSVENIQKNIEYYEQPGYNCSALVTADGVIRPRTSHSVKSC